MLLEYLPPFLREIREYQILGDVGDAQKRELDQAVFEVQDASFVGTAKESYLKRYETMLMIQPSAGDTVEQRRSEILMRYNEHPPFTKRFLYRTLSSLCGEEGFRLTILYPEQKLDLILDSSHWQIDRSLKELLERVVPLNLVWMLRYLYQAGEIPNQEQFFPRTKHWMEFLWWPTGTMLNGAFPLDGSVLLNKVLTEYPMRSRHRLETRIPEWYVGRSRMGGMTVILKEQAVLPDMRNRMQLNPQMRVDVSRNWYRGGVQEAIPPSKVRTGIRLEVLLQELAVGARSAHRIRLMTRTSADSEQLRHRLWLKGPQEEIKPSVRLRASIWLKEASWNQSTRNRSVCQVPMDPKADRYTNRVNVPIVETVGTAGVTINKNLWYMDGSTLLDGSQPLNAYTKTEAW